MDQRTVEQPQLATPRVAGAESSTPRPGHPKPPAPATHTGQAFAIEFAGWLPIFREFGNCGCHPQFAHAAEPPPGYRFVCSGNAVEPAFMAEKADEQKPQAGLRARALVTLAQNCLRWGPMRCVWLLLTVLRLLLALLWGGARLKPALRFLHSRHFSSQIMLPRRPGLLFLTSVPYTYGQHPWVIEIEDSTSLFYPFLRNGESWGGDITASPYFPLVKRLLEADNCRAIITHMRSTAITLPRLFRSELLRTKTHHIPLGVPLPARWQRHEDGEHLDLLFTCSWHQDPASLYLRGGLEVLDAYDIIQARYPHVRLTLRTALPRSLSTRYREIIDRCWVRVISWYLQPQEMDALLCKSHVFLLPAARVHIVSVLKAMSFGEVVIASDGWGFDEYLTHNRNAIIIKGRHGKASWMDEKTGMLHENYERMRTPDPDIVQGLVEAISELAEDRRKCKRLGEAARHDVATRYTLANWNRGLKAVLDRALRK
jgi:glycosyltransferase involved in cell wall biosynthesis